MPSLKQLRFVVLLKLRVREHNRKIITKPTLKMVHSLGNSVAFFGQNSSKRFVAMGALFVRANPLHKEKTMQRIRYSAKLHYSQRIVDGGGSVFFTQK